MSGPRVGLRVYPLRNQLFHQRAQSAGQVGISATTWVHCVLPKGNRFSLFVLSESALKEVNVV